MKRTSRVMLIGGLCVALVLVALGGYVWLITFTDKRIATEHEELRRAGQPVSVEDIFRRYTPGDGQTEESGKLLRAVVTQATEIRKIVENSYAPALLDENGRLTEAGRQRIDEAFQKHEGFLSAVETLLGNPPRPAAPANAATPEEFLNWSVRAVQDVEVIVRMVRHWALYQQELKNWAEVARAASILRRVGEWVSTFPGTIACHSALKAETSAIDLYEILLGTGQGFDDEARKSSQNAFRAIEPLKWCREAVISDRAVGLTLLTRYPGRDSLWARYSWNRVYLSYLEAFRHILEALEKDDFAGASVWLQNPSLPDDAEAVKLIFPTVRQCVREAFLAESRRRELLVALALLEKTKGPPVWKKDQPLKADELGLDATLLRDPFSGAAFRTVVAEDHAVIYSVGPNRQDDGGRSSQGGDDVPFILRWHAAG